MAKKITRTITVYTYTFGTFNPDTFQMENLRSITTPIKLGTRELAKKAQKGEVALPPISSEVEYEMDIETFILYATPVEK